jgi:hypothetical protein
MTIPIGKQYLWYSHKTCLGRDLVEGLNTIFARLGEFGNVVNIPPTREVVVVNDRFGKKSQASGGGRSYSHIFQRSELETGMSCGKCEIHDAIDGDGPICF